jgi:hypothetical protein
MSADTRRDMPVGMTLASILAGMSSMSEEQKRRTCIVMLVCCGLYEEAEAAIGVALRERATQLPAGITETGCGIASP